MAVSTLYATVLSGQKVSDVVAIGRSVSDWGLWSPIVTSCEAYVKVSYDTTSANYARLQNPAGSGDWTLAIGPGSNAIIPDYRLPVFTNVKLELSVAQADTRSFAIMVKT